jgi:hypothetical protein
LSFPGDRWGWLAEAQGNLYLMFEQRLKSGSALAQFDAIELGQSFEVRDESLKVTEKAIAEVAAAEGEIPWAVRPGLPHSYADLKSEGGSIGTLDFSSSPTRFFLGKRVTMESLGMTPNSGWGAPKDITVQALQLNCPKCAGSLELFAPDQSLRVTCPNCNALLDADQGKLKYLETLSTRKIKPVLPLGSKGKLQGKEYTVVGFMRRHVVYEGKTYPWSEYLLYNPEVNFRWLVKTDDSHWSFVEQIDFPGNITSGTTIRYQGDSYRLFDRGDAIVSYVVGEFPWRVTVGETSFTSDYIAPPYMLSFEQTLPTATSGPETVNQEIAVSKGVYVTVDEIEKAFSLTNLRRPLGVGAIQPAPKMGYRFLYSNIAFLVALYMISTLIGLLRPDRRPDGTLLMIAMGFVTLYPIIVLLYRWSYETQRWRNSDFNPYAQS